MFNFLVKSFAIASLLVLGVQCQCPAGQTDQGPCMGSCPDPAATCVGGATCCKANAATTLAPAATTKGGTCVDTNTNCASWIQNGFCNSTFYTSAQKQQYCAKGCNLCSGGGVTSTSKPCVDADSRCPTWTTQNFCANTFYTAAQRCQYCAKSCNLCGKC